MPPHGKAPHEARRQGLPHSSRGGGRTLRTWGRLGARTVSGLSQDCLRTTSGLSQDNFRTASGQPQDSLRATSTRYPSACSNPNRAWGACANTDVVDNSNILSKPGPDNPRIVSQDCLRIVSGLSQDCLRTVLRLS